MLINAESLAQRCRDEAEIHLDESDRLMAGAKILSGLDARAVTQKIADANFEKGSASAYATLAAALERLVAEGKEVAPA